MDVGATDVESVVRAQRRRRRLRFWLGFAVIALVGGLWAGLTKDPLGPGLFDEGVIVDQPAFEVGEFEDFEVPTTTATSAPEPPTDQTTTTGP